MKQLSHSKQSRYESDSRTSSPSNSPTLVYPVLGGEYDLWFTRIGGVGLGNAFFNYFHAVVLAEESNARLISPPWLSLKLGPLLRGESSKRFYFRMFRPFADDLHGLRKLLRLSVRYSKRAVVEIDGINAPTLVSGALNLVKSKELTFQGLHLHRDVVRNRLLSIVNDPIPPGHGWGNGGFVAIHIRLGDFTQLSDPTLISSGPTNSRIPLFWYINIARSLRSRFPDMPLVVFTDGKPEELRPLLDLGATIYRSGSDVTDLLAMASASVLVGSNSTYSTWAAFLGNMPSIWLRTRNLGERPSGPEVPIQYVALDEVEVNLCL